MSPPPLPPAQPSAVAAAACLWHPLHLDSLGHATIYLLAVISVPLLHPPGPCSFLHIHAQHTRWPCSPSTRRRCCHHTSTAAFCSVIAAGRWRKHPYAASQPRAPPFASHPRPITRHISPTRLTNPCPLQRGTAPALQPAKGKICLALSLRDTPHSPPLCFALLVLLDLQLQPRAPRLFADLESSPVSVDSPLLASLCLGLALPFPHLPASSRWASRRPVPVLH